MKPMQVIERVQPIELAPREELRLRHTRLKFRDGTAKSQGQHMPEPLHALGGQSFFT